MKVINSCKEEINFDAATLFMDDDLREEINAELAPCTEQEFFDEYTKRHKEKFGNEWFLNCKNPIW